MTEIRTSLTGRLGSASQEIPIDLIYSDTDPWAVTFDFGPGTKWLVAREIVMAGMARTSGIGDVRFWPSPGSDALWMHLHSPSGEALVEIQRTAVARFLAETKRLVPPGSERMDFREGELTDGC